MEQGKILFEHWGVAISLASFLIGIISLVISVVFFMYANKVSRENSRVSDHMDAIVTEIDEKSMNLVQFAVEAFNRKNVMDDELISGLIEKRDRITENVIDRLLPKIEEVPGGKPGSTKERRILKEELVELTRSSLKESVQSELLQSLEDQRDRVLEAIAKIEGKIKNKHRIPIDDKRQYEELAWKLRQDLDDIKQRIKAISGHT